MVVLRLNQHSFRFCHEETNPPQEKKIYGNWFIYKSWQFLGTKTLRTSIKRYRRVAKSSKPRLHNSICTGTNIVKIWLSLCPVACQVCKACAIFFPTEDQLQFKSASCQACDNLQICNTNIVKLSFLTLQNSNNKWHISQTT